MTCPPFQPDPPDRAFACRWSEADAAQVGLWLDVRCVRPGYREFRKCPLPMGGVCRQFQEIEKEKR